jgi:hypothetical protein
MEVSLTTSANSRVGTTLLLVLIVSTASGCYSAVRALDAQGNLSPGVAILHNSPRSSFWGSSSVLKGGGVLNIQAHGASIAAGTNFYTILVMRRDTLAIFLLTDAFNVDATCAFTLVARPGHTYTLGYVDKGNNSSTEEHKVYRASIAIEESSPDTPAVRYTLPAECVVAGFLTKSTSSSMDGHKEYAGGFLCKESVDCRPETPLCVKEVGYEFGVCEKQ